MSNVIYDRIQKQLYSLERSVRAVRAELECELVSKRAAEPNAEQIAPIGCAMNDLLSRANAFAPVSPSPYEHFFPGLSCGYTMKGAGIPVTVRGLSFAQPSTDDEPIELSTCLMARINIDDETELDWLTFELQLELKDLYRVKSIVTSLVCCFHGPPTIPLGNFRVSLRLALGDDWRTYYTRSFPALSAPFEFSYSIDKQQYRELPLKEAIAAKLLLSLPVGVRVPYDFMVSHCETTGVM